MPCFTFIIWEKWISMDRHGNPMSDMIQHRTYTGEFPGLSSPPQLSLHLQALSCASSPLPYPSIPSVAQNILQVTDMEARWRCSHLQRNPCLQCTPDHVCSTCFGLSPDTPSHVFLSIRWYFRDCISVCHSMAKMLAFTSTTVEGAGFGHNITISAVQKSLCRKN